VVAVSTWGAISSARPLPFIARWGAIYQFCGSGEGFNPGFRLSETQRGGSGTRVYDGLRDQTRLQSEEGEY